MLAKHSPVQSGLTDQFFYVARGGTLMVPALRTRVDESLARLAKDPAVAAVAKPRLSPDGRIGVVDVTFAGKFEDLEVETVKRVENEAFAGRSRDLEVEHGGQGAEFVRFSEQSGTATELIGVLAAFIVLLLTFGSLIAAGIPLLTALLALGATLGLVPVISHVVDTPDFASQLAALIGIGVGIDYALIVVTRYRAEYQRIVARSAPVDPDPRVVRCPWFPRRRVSSVERERIFGARERWKKSRVTFVTEGAAVAARLCGSATEARSGGGISLSGG